jgi:signal recognition particle subunit SRP54
MPKVSPEQLEKAERDMKEFEVIINSMTYEERMHPEILKNSRKTRIARGSGKTNADINRVLKRYENAKEMMKQMKSRSKKGGGGFNPNMFR